MPKSTPQLLKPCIYCNDLVDITVGEGDHVISAQLGEFRNDKRFRRICRECNSKIGKCEQVLLQCGPEAFFRRVVQPAVPSRRQRGISIQGAHGCPAPIFLVYSEDRSHQLLGSPSHDNPQLLKQIDQIVVHDGTGREVQVRLFPGMKPQEVMDQLACDGITKIKKAWLHANMQHEQDYRNLIRQLIPHRKEEDQPVTQVGNHPRTGDIRFHQQWGHILAVHEAEDAVVASIRFFAGPGYVPTEHILTLGKIPTPIITTNLIFGHAFMYDNVQAEVGYAGRVHPLSLDVMIY